MVCTSFIDAIQVIDQDITLFLNGVNCSASDQFWILFSDKITWIPTYLICAFFLFKRLGWKRALIVLASVALSFALCDQFANLIKNSACRLRPSYNHRMLDEGLAVLEGRGGFFGFFSAHAANAFAVAICLIIGFRNDTTHTYNAFFFWALIWAALVAVSRIFVGKHFFLDVVTGSIVGIAFGYFVGMFTRYIIQKYVDRIPVTGLTLSHFKSLS
jgi:PAP2 superfamily.